MPELDIKEVGGGMIVSKGAYAVLRRFIDKEFAKLALYKPIDYVKDLIKSGYLRADPADTDDGIATAIVSPTGYTFVGGPSNLTGTNKLTATSDTYMAAVGQKVTPLYLPSTWLSAIIGVAAAAEAQWNLTGSEFSRTHGLGIGVAGVNILLDGVARGLSVDGVKVAPTGMDVKPGTVQYLAGEGVNMQAIQQMTQENQAMRTQIQQLKGQSSATGTPAGIPGPGVQTQEVPMTPDVRSIKERFGLMDTVTGMVPGPGAVTPAESMRKKFGLMSFGDN